MTEDLVKPTRILGYATDPDLAERLHDLDHRGQVEHIVLARDDMSRHRMRVQTDRGRDCVIVLPRAERLSNGAVLLLDEDRAIVVRMAEEKWLSLLPRDSAAALELGYFAGNMHWRVKFDGDILNIALDGPEQGYLDRLAPMLAEQKIGRRQDG